VIAAGSVLLRRVFEVVAETRSMDTFVATALFVAVGMGALAEQCGLSNTTGAFAAGVLLAGTNYRAQIKADIRPFQGILLGVFFMTAGAGLDPSLALQKWQTVLGLVAGVIVLKSTVLGIILRASGFSTLECSRMSVLLSGGGEFAFVLLTVAKELKVLPKDFVDVLNVVIVLSMSATPFLGQAGDALGKWLNDQKDAANKDDRAAATSPDAVKEQEQESAEKCENCVVICGFGPVGQNVTAILESSLGINSVVAFDLNPARVLEAAVKGLPAVYGDGSSPQLFESSGVISPKAIVVTYANLDRRLQAVEQLHVAYPSVPILVRARSEQEREKLLEAGAQIALSEFSEVSCQLASALAKDVYSKSIDIDEARQQLQGGLTRFSAGPAEMGDNEELEEDLPKDLDIDMIVMDTGMSRGEVLRLYRIFRSIDLDGSGEADFDEVRQLLARSTSSAVSDQQFQGWMNQLDADQSGAVDFEEFLAVYRGKEPA